MNIVVIGGGLFGCCVALELDRVGHAVTLYEQRYDIMLGASKVNHGRLHIGYHYPRSKETARQSMAGLLSFQQAFGKHVMWDFPNYYAIAREGSALTADQYRAFCDAVGISLVEAWPEDGCLAHEKLEACFLVREPVFDWQGVRDSVFRRLRLISHVVVRLKESVGLGAVERADFTVNCAYAGVNRIQNKLGLPEIPLHYEDCIIPVFKWKRPPIGLTVMDGPFCTIMPWGYTTGGFLLYHVVESVLSGNNEPGDDPDSSRLFARAAEWLPFLSTVAHVDTLRTMRVVQENTDDARLTTVHWWPERANYLVVLSGKISTAVQTAIQVREMIEGNENALRYVI